MLRKSPCRTPALLAANRLNALKSTGPRTVPGKARVALNALKHGRYARRLSPRLLRAGDCQDAALYRRLRFTLGWTFAPQSPAQYRAVERLAAQAWYVFRSRKVCGTKPERALDSWAGPSQVFLRSMNCPSPFRRRFGVKDQIRRIGLLFWVQRRRYYVLETMERLLRMVRAGRQFELPSPGEEWETAPRCRVFRLAKPGLEERLLYALDREGRHHPEAVGACRATIREMRREGVWPPVPFKLDPRPPEERL